MKKQMLSSLEGNKTNLSSRQFVGRDLPHPLLLGQEEKQPCFTRDVEDPRQRPSGMTGPFYHGTKAFTLIELLVVVLIIGILAAVALPQYNKAVKKSHLTQWHTYVNAYMKAIDVWVLSNGGYPEGVSYAILIMNCCVVLLDRVGRPKKFGAPKKEVAKK